SVEPTRRIMYCGHHEVDSQLRLDTAIWIACKYEMVRIRDRKNSSAIVVHVSTSPRQGLLHTIHKLWQRCRHTALHRQCHGITSSPCRHAIMNRLRIARSGSRGLSQGKCAETGTWVSHKATGNVDRSPTYTTHLLSGRGESRWCKRASCC